VANLEKMAAMFEREDRKWYVTREKAYLAMLYEFQSKLGFVVAPKENPPTLSEPEGEFGPVVP
jgi:hypothetical protein